MSYWEIIIPEETTNLFIDPQFGQADPDTPYDISATGGSSPDVTRTTTDSWRGDGCALFTFDGASAMVMKDDITVTATSYTLSMRVKRAAGGTVSNSECQAHFDTANSNWDSITALRDNWYLCVKTATATSGSRAFGIRALEDGLLTDAWQLENKAYRTTYTDGSLAPNLVPSGNSSVVGYRWTGQKNNSTSVRHARETSGGRPIDFDTYNFFVESPSGIGLPPITNERMSPALIDGSIHNRSSWTERTISLTGLITGTSYANRHSNRKLLETALRLDAISQQPKRLLYSGSGESVFLDVRYEGGLDASLKPQDGFNETVGLRLLANNPYWSGLGEDAVQLDIQDTATASYIIQRDSAGIWGVMGNNLDATPLAITKDTSKNTIVAGSMTFSGNDNVGLYAGTNFAAMGAGLSDVGRSLAADTSGNVYGGGDGNRVEKWNGSSWSDEFVLEYGQANGAVLAILLSGTTLYVGGSFTSIGGISANYIAKFDTSTRLWSNLGSATALNGAVRALTLVSTTLYVGGSFTNADSVSNRNYGATWDTSTEAWGTWGATGNFNAAVHAITYDSNLAAVWVGGAFTDLAGVSGRDYVGRWVSSAFATVGSINDVNATVRALAYSTEQSDYVYLGGDFTAVAGVTGRDYFCYAEADGSAFNTPASINDVNAAVHAISTFSGSTNVFLGGAFTAVGGVSGRDYFCRYVRFSVDDFFTVGSINDVNATVRAIKANGDATAYLGGDFTDLAGVSGRNKIGYAANFSSFTTVGALNDLNNSVHAVSVDGLYAGGDFTNAAGVAENDYFAINTGSSFDSSADIHAIALDSGDNLYVGTDRGSFYKWDGSVLSLGNDVGTAIYALAIDGSDDVFIGGDFTNFTDANGDYITKYDSSAGTFASLGTGLNGICRALALNPVSGVLAVGGAFTTAGGQTSNKLALWDGVRWNTVTTSLSSETIYALAWSADGSTLYIGGDFTSIGGVTADGIAKLIGSDFFAMDFDLPGSPTVYAIHADNETLTIGFSTTGTFTTPGQTTITYNGTAPGEPVFTLSGPGEVRSITNQTTGEQILFQNLTLGTNETVTLDLRRLVKKLSSNQRGTITGSKVDPRSALSSFALVNGANTIATLILNASASGHATWELLYDSVSGAAT